MTALKRTTHHHLKHTFRLSISDHKWKSIRSNCLWNQFPFFMVQFPHEQMQAIFLHPGLPITRDRGLESRDWINPCRRRPSPPASCFNLWAWPGLHTNRGAALSFHLYSWQVKYQFWSFHLNISRELQTLASLHWLPHLQAGVDFLSSRWLSRSSCECQTHLDG